MTSKDLQFSYGTVLRILKRKLGWKPYRSFQAPAVTPAHIDCLSACNFWVNFSDEWFDRVIWTDEKMFVLTQAPHRQNDRVWSAISRNKIAECKILTGEK